MKGDITSFCLGWVIGSTFYDVIHTPNFFTITVLLSVLWITYMLLFETE
jgi:hypothetical protein